VRKVITNSKSRASKTFILIVARFSDVAIAVALSVTLSRLIDDKSAYGSIQQLLMLYSMLSVIFACGIPQSIYYFLPRYAGGLKKGFLIQNLGMLFLQGLLLGIILFNLRNWLGNNFNSPLLPNLLQVFAVYPVLMLPTLASEGVLITFGRVRTFMLFKVLSRGLTYLSLVIPVILKKSLYTAIIVWDISAFIIMLISIYLIMIHVWKEEFTWNHEMLKRELKYSIPLAIGAILSSIIVYTDRVVISKILGAANFAIYANGAIELPLIGIITGAVQSVLMADFSLKSQKGLNKEILSVWHRAVFKTSIILLPFWGFLFFWAKDFIILLFSQRYEESSQIFSIYLWMTPVKIFTFSSILLPLGASLLFTEINLVNALLAILIIPTMATYFGMKGAALGFIIVCWFVFFYGIIRSSNLLQISFKEFLPWKKILILSGAILSIGAISRFVINHIKLIDNNSFRPEFISFGNLCIGGLIFLFMYLIFLEGLKYFSIREYIFNNQKIKALLKSKLLRDSLY